MTEFPPRIHVLLASHARVGLVIRRGPSKLVATFLWNRECDSFHLGQWLKGRIFERRSDLSPDGKHFIYFAMNAKWRSEAQGAWTAVSRAPYLKALAIFPKGNCWHGGGLWTSAGTYWINDGCGHSVLRDTKEVRRDMQFQPSEHFGGECLSVYYPRLMRDGWHLVERGQLDSSGRRWVFERSLGQGWTLRKIAHAGLDRRPGQGCYWDEHQLVHAKLDRAIDCRDWEWADRDRDRVAWAAGGKLFGAAITTAGLTDERELFDFNPLAFEPIKAPY